MLADGRLHRKVALRRAVLVSALGRFSPKVVSVQKQVQEDLLCLGSTRPRFVTYFVLMLAGGCFLMWQVVQLAMQLSTSRVG